MSRGVLAAIDIGTSKVCSVVADVEEEGSLHVVAVGNAVSHGMLKGVITSPEEVTSAIRKSLDYVEQVSEIKIDSVFVSISGKHINSFNNRVVVDINHDDHVVAEQHLVRGIKSTRDVSLSEDKMIVHDITRGYSLDGQWGIKDPIGMYGYKLGVEAHIVTVGTSFLQNTINCVRKANVNVEDIVINSVASSEAVLSQEEKHRGVILADIGDGTTDIAVWDGGSICYSAVLPVGGRSITRDLAVGLEITSEDAERLKKEYGNVAPGATVKSGLISLELGTRRVISNVDIYHIIRARAEEILRMIALDWYGVEQELRCATSLVLCGGTANLHGIRELAEEVFNCPVRIGSPGVGGAFADMDDPSYATVAGLVIWGANKGSSSVASITNTIGAVDNVDNGDNGAISDTSVVKDIPAHSGSLWSRLWDARPRIKIGIIKEGNHTNLE